MLDNICRRFGHFMTALTLSFILVLSGLLFPLSGQPGFYLAAHAQDKAKAKPVPAGPAAAEGWSSGNDQPFSSNSTVVPEVAGDGAVRVNNLANLEALLNIIANGIEILGIANVGSYFVGAIIAFIRRRMILGTLLVLLCPVSLIGGLAAPGVINWLVASARDANLTESPEAMAVMLIPMVVCAFAFLLAVGFIPAIVAFRAKHEQRWIIFFMTFIAWIVPFGWPALLFWALVEPKKFDSPKQELL